MDNKKNSQPKPKKKKSTIKKNLVSYNKLPENMSLEEWQKNLRKQFGEKSEFQMKNMGTHPVYTDFNVTNPENDSQYKVSIRPKPYSHFCSCKDYKSNHLETCKHIEFVLFNINKNTKIKSWLSKDYKMPYTSISLEYKAIKQIRIRIGQKNAKPIQKLANEYFDQKGYLLKNKYTTIDIFIQKTKQLDPEFKCYEDAMDHIIYCRSKEYRIKRVNTILKKEKHEHYFKNLLKAKLFQYQMEGIIFSVKEGRSIIADEMGLGKTIQAIGVAEMLKKEFGITRVLIICPTSLKYQWQSEINKFSQSDTIVVEGNSLKRKEQYEIQTNYQITSYNCIKYDINSINQQNFDLVILDEAQRIKNWDSMTSRYVKRIDTPYALVLTGTPLENKLKELYSIVQYIDPYILGPLYQFIHNHTIFDENQKVIGYNNLHKISERLNACLIRRLKKDVMQQLPERIDKIHFVPMTHEQMDIHQEYQSQVSRLIARWRQRGFLTENERKKLQIFLNFMRMSCDSTYIIDQKTRHDHKIEELFLLLDEIFSNPNNKVVIFSQWERMTRIISMELTALNIQYSYLHGGIESKKRKLLIDVFNTDTNCKVFLSTDAGSVGLNLQSANYIINMDLPWNPAVLEQRIGRIHRIGQKNNILVVNFVSIGTIEERMLSVLKFKSSIAQGILDKGEDIVFMETKAFNSMMNTIENLTEVNATQDTQYLDEKELEEDLLHDLQSNVSNEHDEEVAEYNKDTHDLSEVQMLPNEKNIAKNEKTQVTLKTDKVILEERQQLELVLNQGLSFITGMIKLGTGKEMTMNDATIQIDKESGEVTFKFKLPN